MLSRHDRKILLALAEQFPTLQDLRSANHPAAKEFCTLATSFADAWSTKAMIEKMDYCFKLPCRLAFLNPRSIIQALFPGPR